MLGLLRLEQADQRVERRLGQPRRVILDPVRDDDSILATRITREPRGELDPVLGRQLERPRSRDELARSGGQRDLMSKLLDLADLAGVHETQVTIGAELGYGDELCTAAQR